MKDNYRKLGEYIQPVDVRNSDLRVSRLLGLSIEKYFIESIANTIGTDFRPYKIVKKGQFAYGPVTSRNGDKITIALLKEPECIISSSYAVFEITDTSKLLPEYLMLWFSRPEFDRYARFKSHGSVREIFDWDEMCRVELPVPEISEQQRIVDAYNTVDFRIRLLQKINEILEESTQCIFEKKIINNDNCSKGYFSQFIKDSIGGDWGKDKTEGNYTKKVSCIRGADIPDTRIGITKNAPIRFILEKNYENKYIHEKDFIIEISGGSPTQSTGRITYISEELLSHSLNNLICSNFCRVLRIKEGFYQFFYQYWNYLYKKGTMFNYENSSTGLKNFDLDTFLNNEKINVPETNIIFEFENEISPFITKIHLNGFEIEKLNELKQMIISTISKR